MPIYKTKLIKREEVAEGTMAFYFEKPQDFIYTAGQYINIRLIDPPETDDEGTRRFFSVAAAPNEPYLMSATRLRDTAFKRILKNMSLGSEVEIFGPSGRLVLHEDTLISAVFLAGGIGITPFRSMVIDAAFRKLPHKIFLFYSNRRPEDSAFLPELINAQNENPNYRFIGTMTNMDKSQKSWSGETGFINKDMLVKYLGDLTKPIYYIAGPPAMVEAMQRMLTEAGVLEENIKVENFTGY